MRKFITSILTAFYCSLTWAVNGISISQNTIGNGLESQFLNTLAKDRQGRLWVGSEVGISLISNGTVTNIRDIATEGGLVMLGNVSSIVCTESVLLSCEDRILHYDRKNSIAHTLRYDDRILHTNDFLLEENKATFYEKESRSLYSYDMETMECNLEATFAGNEEYSFSKILRSESDPNILYLPDDALGLYMFNRQTGSLSRVPGTDCPIEASATIIDRSNIIWLSVPGQGVKGYYINSNYELVATYNTRNCGLLSNDISFMTSLPNGNLLTCHYDEGTSIIDRENLETGNIQFKTVPQLKNIKSTIVNSLDRETLYATSGFGLISIKKTFIGQIRHLHEQSDEIINYDYYISAIEESDGTVLLGTMDDGICRIVPQTSSKTQIAGTRHLRITSMCRFDEQNILMADAGSGLILFNSAKASLKPLTDDPVLGVISNGKTNSIRLIASPDGDIFIFNADSRHYAYRKQTNTLEEFTLTTDDGQPVKTVERVCCSPYAIYVTSRGSIIETDYNTLRSRSIYNNKDKVIHNITSIMANSSGELFFTEPEGLHRYDPRSNFDELLVETWGNGRFMNVAIDRKDRIWFTTTNEYLQMFDMSDRELLLYSVEDGVPSSRFLNTFSVCTQSGIVLFPNANGLVTINTNATLMYDTPPVPVNCISAGTDKRFITGAEIQNSLNKPVKLPAKFTELNLELSANAFNPTYPHLFMYSIYRDNLLVMSFSTTNPSITIPKLESGTYSLVIRQPYRKGLSEPETIFRFKIPKPFLATIPGVLISLFIMLAFGYSIARISSTMEKNRMEKALAAQDIKNREDKIAFLSNIAHELRTPLSLIYNPVKDFLQEKSVDGIDYERMERIFNQVNKMTVMVNMILDSSRADINKADILVEEVNLNEWLNFLLEDYRIDCYGKGFSLKFLMDNSIGTVSIDKRIVETGLSNMVNNAIKYSNSGTTITVSTTRIGDMIRVSVKDQGRGFTCNPEDLFKRYYRENDDSSIPGYGLGLPYARLQLSLIGGNMSAINNEDGVGSTFYMDFPASLNKNGAPGHRGNNAEESTTEYHKPHGKHESNTEEGMAQDFDTNDMTILLVSDREDEQDAFKNEFGSMFRLIITAHDGKEAVNMLKRMNIDIVISDADMPGMNGFELCHSIKSTLEISHIPVILLTTRSDERNRNLGYKMGADAFIARPFDMKQMYAIIRSQLGGRFEIRRQYYFGFFSKMNPDQTFSMTDEEFIRSLNTLIEQNISDAGLNGDTIHDRLGISHTVMLKKMEGLLGTNVTNYLRRIRISIVKDRLTNTDDDLETIARETGFNDVESMDTAFKRETGKTAFSVREE